MKAELVNFKNKGICILISDINPNDFMKGNIPFFNMPFRDIQIIAQQIREGKKIGAIKEIRSQTGWGLKESKDYIDKYIPPGFSHNDSAYNSFADAFISAHVVEDFIDSEEMML